MFRPLNNRVLIKPDENQERVTQGGIILPESKEKPLTGTIMVGGVNVKKGDKVVFSKFGFDEVTIKDTKYYCVNENLILGIF